MNTNTGIPSPAGWLRSAWQFAVDRLRPPVTKPLPPSPYKDSTQIGILCQGTFTPDVFGKTGFVTRVSKDGVDKEQSFADEGSLGEALSKHISEGWKLRSIDSKEAGPLPQITGLTRVYKSFKPNKAILTESVTAVWSAPGLPDRTLHETVTNADDLVMVYAFSGNDNCFPTAPSPNCGIAGPTFSMTTLENGISWPTVNAGIDMSIGLAIESSVLSRATGRCSVCKGSDYLPAGYGFLPRSITVQARFNLLGPSLR